MKEKNIDIWKRKLDWIAEHGGMALINTHPDYMNFKNSSLGLEEYPVNYYTDFLKYVLKKYKGKFINKLPCELSQLWYQLYSHLG